MFIQNKSELSSSYVRELTRFFSSESTESFITTNAAPQEAILFCLCGPLEKKKKKKKKKIRGGENGSSRFPRKLQGDATCDV